MNHDPPKAHPLNAPGGFYVLNGYCIACAAPEHEAPDLMAHDGTGHCYFKRQPITPEEEEMAIMAVAVGCCGAVRYGGQDPRIINRLVELGSEDCDSAMPEKLP